MFRRATIKCGLMGKSTDMMNGRTSFFTDKKHKKPGPHKEIRNKETIRMLSWNIAGTLRGSEER